MVIVSVEQVSPGCVKITTSAGPSFFIRLSYLQLVQPEQIAAGSEFLEDRETDILDAGMTYSAEHKAVDYLARAEQSRAGLTRKLSAKGFEKKYIDCALDYLEDCSYLSDIRFAGAWLNSRKISHYEGRSKLAAELAARGIGRQDAAAALDEFFETNSEKELFNKAVAKCRRLGKTPDKMRAYLAASGFSFRLIDSLDDL